MTDEAEARAPRKRSKVQLALATAMVLLVVGTQIVSHRPRLLTNRPFVVPVGDLSAKDLVMISAAGDTLITIPADDYLPPIGMKAAPDYSAPATPPMLGYSIREVSALGMPFAAYKDQGFVLYDKDAGSFHFTALDEASVKAIEDATERKLTTGYAFPWWQYVWGWALIALVAAWGWVWWRSAVERREESGIL